MLCCLPKCLTKVLFGYPHRFLAITEDVLLFSNHLALVQLIDIRCLCSCRAVKLNRKSKKCYLYDGPKGKGSYDKSGDWDSYWRGDCLVSSCGSVGT